MPGVESSLDTHSRTAELAEPFHAVVEPLLFYNLRDKGAKSEPIIGRSVRYVV